MTRFVLKPLLTGTIALALFANVVNAQSKVIDKTFYPAANFLAYTEFELSGEPLAEALGLDLDMLDPFALGLPSAFDYAAGIESYEYSEEAMYALNYQSSMGIHLLNGPLNQFRGGDLSSLEKRINTLASAVAFERKDIPKNMYLLSIPFTSGLPEFAQKVDTRGSFAENIEILDVDGNAKTLKAIRPNYQQDFSTLAWNKASFDLSFEPAAIGGLLLKEVMWSQDFLAGMHVIDSDEEVEAKNSQMDQDGIHALGVSAADGFNGMLLTEQSIDKLLILQQQLGFDGKQLGAEFDLAYDPSKRPVWLPHKVGVTTSKFAGVNAIGKLKVLDRRSTLRDTWQLLWPLAEFYAFSDQRLANLGRNPAMAAVFDGAPFAATPKVNADQHSYNDVVGIDAFSLANNLSNLMFNNILTLHFNSEHGTLIDSFDGKNQSSKVNTFDAAYALVALSIFQRAKDALPVGYAAGDAGAVNLRTPEGQKAMALIKSQADFIVDKLVNPKGLVAAGFDLDSAQVDQTISLDCQFATIRGLVAAFLTTGDQRYRATARHIYLAVEKHMFDQKLGTWATVPGKPSIHTPYTAAAISGGLRATMLQLRNLEGEEHPSLELQTLTERYVAWFNIVINGAMQLAEPLNDTGEVMLKQVNGGDLDGDGVKSIIAAGGQYGTAPTLAHKVRIQ